jgi:hypothetical protein
MVVLVGGDLETLPFERGIVFEVARLFSKMMAY